MRIAPRLFAWGFALVAVALITGGLVLDRIAAVEHVPEAGSMWLYPFLRTRVLPKPLSWTAVVLGTGKRLFGETSDRKSLQLVSSRTVGDGVAILIYQPSEQAKDSGAE